MPNWSDWLLQSGGAQAVAALLPRGRETQPWAPVPADVKLAWVIYNELRTRVTTQGLALRDGAEASALQSVYDFFKLARSAVNGHVDAVHAAALVVHALNQQVRPFTAAWHSLALQGRLRSADERFRFRHELAQLQQQLRLLCVALARLAGDEGTIDFGSAAAAAAAPTTPLPFGVSETGPHQNNLRLLNQAEQAEVLARRRFYGLASAATAHDAVGLALSGGGIRSATFGLGVLQVLARRGWLTQVDFLSTVSGGGYLGSFISSTLNHADLRASLKNDARSLPFGAPGEAESLALRHLRNHSKYLAEGGWRTGALLAFALLYGVLVSLLLVSPWLALAAAAVVAAFGDALVAGATAMSLPAGLRWLPWCLWGGFAASVVAFSAVRGRDALRRFEQSAAGFLVAALLLSCVLQLPWLFQWAEALGVWRVLGGAALLPFVLGGAALLLGAHTLRGRVLLAALVLAGPIFFLAAGLAFIAVFRDLQAMGWWAPWAVVATLFAYTGLVLNINFASLHRYYRDRLARTYLTRSAAGAAGAVGDVGGVAAVDPQPLAQMNGHAKAPYQLINAALNVPGSDHAELRGRASDFFVFSKHFCGSALTGWWPTAVWQKMDAHLDLGTAMAISGAAAAPRMGAMTSRRYTVLMAMLNIRLGYWLRQPRADGAAPAWWEAWLPPTGWLYFAHELLGTMDGRQQYLNLSDGGHIENLGLYELLRRRCKTIIAIDGEADPEHRFEGLLTLVRLARIDLGVTLAPRLDELRLDAHGDTRSHFIVTAIRYADGSCGWLLYIKLSMTGNEGEWLNQYRRQHASFPHETTAQQLYSEPQFEAYRALGEHAGQALFAPHLPQTADSLNAWVVQLAGALAASEP